MVDSAISAQFGLIYGKKLLASKAIFSHSFNHRASNSNTSFYIIYGYFIMDCAFDYDRAIVVAMVNFSISANVVLYILKSLFSPFRMTIFHMLSVRQVIWRVIYPTMGRRIFLIEACLLTSNY